MMTRDKIRQVETRGETWIKMLRKETREERRKTK